MRKQNVPSFLNTPRAIRDYTSRRSSISRQAEVFLNPSSAADGRRILYPDDWVEPACPVYQRGVQSITFDDLGTDRVKAVMLNPSPLAPVLVSSMTVPQNSSYTLCDLNTAVGGQLREVRKGKQASAGNISTTAPLFASFAIPKVVIFAIGDSMAIPIHGSFSEEENRASGSSVGGMSFIDFTALLPSSIGVNAIPAYTGQDVCAVISVSKDADFGAGDFQFDAQFTTAAGGLLTASANMPPWIPGAGNRSINARVRVAVPATAVGLVGCRLRNAAGVIQTLEFTRIAISLRTLTVPTVDPSMSLGAFTGQAVSGMNSLAQACYGGRVTALSLLVTNTSSALNTNGFITATGLRTLPSACGVVGSATAAALTTSKTFKVMDGAYAALACPTDNPYSAVDSSPPIDTNRVLMYIQGSDDPVSIKLEYHMVYEVLSNDPLFPPSVIEEFDVQALRKTGGYCSPYLILTENAFHLRDISKFLSKYAQRAGDAISALTGKPQAAAIGKSVASVINAAQGGVDLISKAAGVKKGKSGKKAS